MASTDISQLRISEYINQWTLARCVQHRPVWRKPVPSVTNCCRWSRAWWRSWRVSLVAQRAGWAYCLEFLNSAEILVGFCGWRRITWVVGLGLRHLQACIQTYLNMYRMNRCLWWLHNAICSSLIRSLFPLFDPVWGTGLEADLPMLRVPEKVNNVGILMITGQRGTFQSLSKRIFGRRWSSVTVSSYFLWPGVCLSDSSCGFKILTLPWRSCTPILRVLSCICPVAAQQDCADHTMPSWSRRWRPALAVWVVFPCWACFAISCKNLHSHCLGPYHRPQRAGHCPKALHCGPQGVCKHWLPECSRSAVGNERCEMPWIFWKSFGSFRSFVATHSTLTCLTSA